MSDYGALPGSERTPLVRAFVAAFEQAMKARAALEHPVGEPLGPDAQADVLAEQLTAAARRLAREAMAWTGAAGEADIALAQYAFVAVLDELLLFSEWPGSAAWESRPLEMRVFGTRVAGERLPDAIETLLAERDPARRDLANVFLACLTLGFKGRLRGTEGALRHDQLRHALFAFAMQRDAEPAHLVAPLERVAVGARHALPLTQMFPDVARFALLLAGGLLVLLGLSHLVWSIETARVRGAVEQFVALSLVDGRSGAVQGTSVSGSVVPQMRTPYPVELPRRDADSQPAVAEASSPMPVASGMHMVASLRGERP
jgi:type IV/VI secretion system ImpK/VasF family protein